MTAAPNPRARELLRASIEAGDPAVDVYLDRRTMNVVKVRDGRCEPDDLDAEQVDEDEERFAEIPVVTVTEEYLWMQDFTEDYGDARVTSLLDGKKGANQRFLKQLARQAPDAAAAWAVYRSGRVDALLDEWLHELGVGREGEGEGEGGTCAQAGSPSGA